MQLFKYWNLSGVPCPFYYIHANSITEADKAFQAEFGVHPSKLNKIVVRFENPNYSPGYPRKDYLDHLPAPTFFYEDLLTALYR